MWLKMLRLDFNELCKKYFYQIYILAPSIRIRIKHLSFFSNLFEQVEQLYATLLSPCTLNSSVFYIEQLYCFLGKIFYYAIAVTCKLSKILLTYL